MGKYDIGQRYQNNQQQWFTIVEVLPNKKRGVKFDDCDIIRYVGI